VPNPLNSVLAPDNWTEACTISDVAGGRGGNFAVKDFAVLYALQYGGRGSYEWTDEAEIDPGGGSIEAGATGVRFRNRTAGSVATVSARIAPPAQPVLMLGYTGTVVISGVSPGAELAYQEQPNTVVFFAQTEATASVLVTAPPIVCDGTTPIKIEFFAPAITNTSSTDNLALYQDGVSIGQIYNSSVLARGWPGVIAARRFVPVAGSHTYSIRAWVTDAAGGTLLAGAGGAGALMPAFILITVAG
jgi:hypothetical protein